MGLMDGGQFLSRLRCPLWIPLGSGEYEETGRSVTFTVVTGRLCISLLIRKCSQKSHSCACSVGSEEES
jgi:hypothetical protein